MKSGSRIQQQLAAVALSCLISSSGLAQAAPSPQQPSVQAAPVPASTTAAAPDAPSATQTQAPPMSIAQQDQQATRVSATQQPFHVELPHSRNPFSPYMPSDVPVFDLHNSARLQNLIRDGKLYLSLKDAIALALENNLDLAYFRYNLPVAETDLARTKAGGLANGVNVSTLQSAPGGNGTSFSSAGSSNGGAGSSNGSAGSAAGGAGGLVTSTLGQGTTVHGFDPNIYFQGWTDHQTTLLTNSVTVGGVPIYHQNTVEGQAEYSQYFPLGTNVQFYYTGLRQTTNSAANSVNPTLQSNFQLFIYQPVLAGFGLATNTRYIKIAKKNQQLTDLGFRAQVIATTTQVENIYWDLVNAYVDEQIKERSLQFANQTLSDDQKQLELQAIPAVQVLKDESDVAAREGDLTVAKTTQRLNELLLKNVLTKTIDDPQLEEMPIVPLDLTGNTDQNGDRPTEELIALAEKNRPDVAMEQITMEIAQNSLKSIKNELLPSLSLYGEYAGIGNGGLPNPLCTGCPATGFPTTFWGSFENAFNYSSPEYQIGFILQITLRNRVAKADQFRSVLEFRQHQIQFEEQKKTIRFDVRNSQFALQQARARVDAAQKARDLAQKTFDTTKSEQDLGSKSSLDTLAASHDLAVAESALATAQNAYEKAKVDIDRAIGDTLEHMGISIEDARSGVVTHNM